jgi:iron complex outermembrane receptor protein
MTASHRNHPSARLAWLRPALALCSCLATLPGRAQSSPEPILTLEKMVAEAKAADVYEVLPSRDSSSVFGTSRSQQDTPRSVTLLESTLIDLYGIQTVNDFVAVTAGTFTGNYFGVPGALDVRGERADNFFRGFRRIENRGNFPTPVAGTDFVEIIKGPPVYGGGKVGGILNFIPKSAKSKTAKFIDHPVGTAAITVGTYGKKVASLEYGTPFKLFGKQSGVYAFLEREDSESYYDNIYNKDTIFQLAFDTELSDSVLLEYGGMAQWADLNQSLGWNRVTQAMIDGDGTYLAGRPALSLDTSGNGFLSPAEIGAYGLEQFAFANPFPYGALTANQRAAFALDPATVRTVQLSHHTIQAEAIDFSRTDAITAFFDVTKTFSPDLTLKNQSFYDAMNHTKYSSYGFTADYTDVVFENKTTVHYKFAPSEGTVVDNLFGASYRYTSGDERESRGRGYQVLDRRDISGGATANDRFEGAHTGTGNVPYNWRQIGTSTDFGVFALVDTTFQQKLSLILSARWDAYEADTNGTDLGGNFAKASGSENAFTYNASLSYRAANGLTPYVTYAESSYVELGQGGMIDRLNLEGGTWQKTTLINSPFFLGVTPSFLGLDPALTYGGRFVAVGGLIGIPAGRETPTPRKVFSVGGTYTSPQGWGASLGGSYVSAMYAGYLQQIRLPSYLVTRAALFYHTGPWSFRLNGTNILNEKYYTPQFLFWDTFISPSKGPTVELSAAYKW